jgi:hypothetical protein
MVLFTFKQIQTISTVKLERRLGTLTNDEMKRVLAAWLIAWEPESTKAFLPLILEWNFPSTKSNAMKWRVCSS